MNHSPILFLLALLSLFACKNDQEAPAADPAETVTVDVAAIEAEAGSLMDQYYAANQGDVDQLLALTAEDGLFLGTDSSEVMSQQEIVETYRQYLEDPELAGMLKDISFDVLDRRVMVSESGNEVMVVDLVDVSFSELPVRGVAVMSKRGEDWKIVFSSLAFLIDNEDLETVDAAIGG